MYIMYTYGHQEFLLNDVEGFVQGPREGKNQKSKYSTVLHISWKQ